MDLVESVYSTGRWRDFFLKIYQSSTSLERKKRKQIIEMFLLNNSIIDMKGQHNV